MGHFDRIDDNWFDLYRTYVFPEAEQIDGVWMTSDGNELDVRSQLEQEAEGNFDCRDRDRDRDFDSFDWLVEEYMPFLVDNDWLTLSQARTLVKRLP